MVHSDTQNRQSLTGSCPCTTISWLSTTSHSKITICHCKQCKSTSSTNTSIAYSSFPNDSLHFSNGANPSVSVTSDQIPNIALTETELAVRGSCERCGVLIWMKYHCVLIWMKYHCVPEETDMNMGLCGDEAALGDVRGATEHIFFEGQVEEGEKAWRGFSDGMSETLARWDQGGKKRRADV